MKTTFKQFLCEENTQFFKTYEEVDSWLKMYSIDNYEIDSETLRVTVGSGGVNLASYNKEYLPVQFDTVDGPFEISHASKLKSLVGSPTRAEHFDCISCISLTSLNGCPKECVDFNCSGCTSLTSLEGGPEKVENNYVLMNCPKITSFKGLPKRLDASLLALGSPIKTITGLDRILLSANLIQMDFEEVEGGLLSLLKIKDLDTVMIRPSKQNKSNKQLVGIINKYLPEGDIFACQQELIDAGLEAYAKL